jgi:predicted TIM-barrel fold metal-dependent hydrolase
LLAAPLVASCWWLQGNPPSKPPDHVPGAHVVIDAHAHIVNGRDVPIYGFVKYVYFREHVPGGALADAAIHLLEDVIQDSAPDHDEEAANLCGLIEKAARPAPPGCPVAVVHARAAGTPRLRPESAPANPTGASLDRPRTYLNGRLQDPALRAAVVGSLQRARLQPALPGAARRALRPMAALAADAAPEVAAESFLQMFGELIRDFSSWRINNLYALERLYPDVDLFVTTLLDFDKWVYEESNVPLPKQVELMTMIAIASDGRVLPFVPFDPWRDVATGGAALASIQAAVASGGAVGVKLYPPMGFRASGNDQSFADWQAGLDRDHLGADFGQQVDARLEALYAWGERDGVPILAHTGASNFSRDSAADDSHPRYWAAVLARHQGLRLDLSHLGGQEPEHASWRDDVMALFRYPNVYGDVACFQPQRDAESGFWSRLEDQIAGNAGIGRRLLYGSDWFLLSDCAAPEGYESTLRQTAADTLGADGAVRLFGENAVDYLGLRRGQPARQRLDRFYERYKVEGAWRGVVDRQP